MSDMTNFYDELDLKYPEIAIAMQDIDRVNPGKIKFSIPILTPSMDNNTVKENTERQNTSNLMNADKKGLDIQNIKMSNYIEIPVPSELCTLDSGTYEIVEGTINISNASESLSGSANGNSNISGNIAGSGTVSEYTGSINVNGSVKGTMTINGLNISGTTNLIGGQVNGSITIIPTDRIIPAGSKWIVVFIGGDITKPRIIGRYIEG